MSPFWLRMMGVVVQDIGRVPDWARLVEIYVWDPVPKAWLKLRQLLFSDPSIVPCDDRGSWLHLQILEDSGNSSEWDEALEDKAVGWCAAILLISVMVDNKDSATTQVNLHKMEHQKWHFGVHFLQQNALGQSCCPESAILFTICFSRDFQRKS